MQQLVSNRQLILIGAMYTLDATLISVQGQMAQYAQQQVWLAHLLGAAIIAVPVWMLARVMSRFPNRDLFEALVERFPAMGRVVSALYVAFFFYILVRDLRMSVDFTNVALLPTTPLEVTAVMIVLSVVFLTTGGIEILARTTEMYGAALLMAVLAISVLLFREFDVTYALPLLDANPEGIAVGTWFILSYLGEAIGVAFLCSGCTMRPRVLLGGLLLGTAALLLLAVQCLLVLGIPVMSRMLYPNYELVRQLRITDFLDRFELPLVGLWLPTIITKIGYSLYIVCVGIKRIIPGVSGQRLVAPVAFLALACSFWFFESAIQMFNLNRTWPAASLFFQLLLPTLLFAALRPKAEKRAAPSPAPGGGAARS